MKGWSRRAVLGLALGCGLLFLTTAPALATKVLRIAFDRKTAGFGDRRQLLALVVEYGEAHLMTAEREVCGANSADGARGIADDGDFGHGGVSFQVVRDILGRSLRRRKWRAPAGPTPDISP